MIKCQAKIDLKSSTQRQSQEASKNDTKHQICPSDKKSWTSMFKWVDNENGEEEQVQEWVDKRACINRK